MTKNNFNDKGEKYMAKKKTSGFNNKAGTLLDPRQRSGPGAKGPKFGTTLMGKKKK